MKSIKIGLIMLVIVMLGLFLSSCSTVGKISSKIISKDSDKKFCEGIILNNLEMVKEALEDGANINKIDGTGLTESNPIWLGFSPGVNGVRISEYLINHGADVNCTDDNGDTLLPWMACNVDVHFCELLIKHGAKVNDENKRGYTALEYVVDHSGRATATEKNIDSVITILLEHGAKIRPITLKAALKSVRGGVTPEYMIKKRILDGLLKEGYTSGLDPTLEAVILGESSKLDVLIKANKMKKEDEQQVLFTTVAYGNVETLKLLEDKGVELKPLSTTLYTPLDIAAYYGNLSVVKYLVVKGVNIEARTSENNGEKSALNMAIENEQYDVAKYLIEKGANIKPFTIFAGSVDILSEAAKTGNISMLKLILDSDHTITKERKEKAAVSACSSNKIEVLKYFLDNGIDINISSNDDFLLNAANLDVTKFLVEHGAKVDGVEGKGKFLNFASEGGITAEVEYLLKKGANVNAVAEEAGLKFDSALMKATVSGNLDTVKLLVENGADLEQENEFGNGKKNTVIITSAACGSRNILEYLLTKSAKVNYQNQEGETALMLATSKGRIDNVKILLKYKVDISLKNKNGQTALDIAKK